MSKNNIVFHLFFSISIFNTIELKTEKNDSKLWYNVCRTKACVIQAANLLNTIDESVSPCDDFYQFSCGKWIQNKILREDKSSVDQFNDLQDELNEKLKNLLLNIDIKMESKHFIKKTKNYFDTCLNTTRIEEEGDNPLLNLLNQLGGWPLVAKRRWKEINWTDIYLKLRQLGYTSSIFLSISVYHDFYDTSRRIINIDQPSFGLKSRDSILKGSNDPSVKAYKNFMSKIAMKLGARPSSVNSSVKEIFDFEFSLANNSMAKELRRNMTQIYNKVKLKQLIKMAPNLNWLKILRGYVSESITEDEEIVLFDTQYIKFLNKFLPAQNNKIIKDNVYSLNEEWLHLKDQYDFVVSGTKTRQSRSDLCMKYTQNTLGIALSYLYVKNFFSDVDKQKASQMFINVLKEFKRSLVANTWMADMTRAEALTKVDSLKLMIGYPNEIKNESKLEVYYDKLQIDSSNFFENNARLSKWSTDLEFGQLRETNSWQELGSVVTVNAFCYQAKNLVVMPAGILQGAFYNRDRPDYLNYGSIAYIFGHEIIHGFDDGGKQYDSEGKLRNWWDSTTGDIYTEKSQCIINQYNNFNATQINEHLNGVNTQGENIADNGGVLQSYRAYVKYVEENGPESKLPALDYSPEQLFWISSAVQWCSKQTNEYLKLLILNDGHSPSKARTNCVVSNSVEFSKAFNCPMGSPMNPINKCRIW